MRDNPKMAAEAVAAVVPEVKASTAIGSVTDTIPLLFNEVTEKDGQGVFEPRRLATTWKWVAKAQKLKENPPPRIRGSGGAVRVRKIDTAASGGGAYPAYGRGG